MLIYGIWEFVKSVMGCAFGVIFANLVLENLPKKEK
jgi:hypothetical protein